MIHGSGKQFKTKQIAVIGASEADLSEILAARMVGKLLAEQGVILLSGGMGGVMEASCLGAREADGISVGIVPGAEGNKHLDIVIKTRMDQSRNVVLVGSADAVIAIGGEYGTLSEIAYSLKMHIPVFGLMTWDIPGVIICSSPEEAVHLAMNQP
jgi:uncharacterized protein (TIGR00725 family)